MTKTKVWIEAMRLRTLPLSLAGIIMGSGLAAYDKAFRLDIFILALLTAVSYQILSNLANDYGDGVKGTDRQRQGPRRTVASGLISARQMKKAILINILLSIFLTLVLLRIALHRSAVFYLYLFLGITAILAAIKYTVGNRAYGYRGLGDLFVLIFFGWVAVAGSYYLFTRHWNTLILLPAFSIGFLSVMVLNINNMRDYENDRFAGKKTIPVQIGLDNAVKYHRALLTLTFLFMAYFTAKISRSFWPWVAFLLFIPLFKHAFRRIENNPEKYNQALKHVSLTTFLFAIVYVLFLNL